MCRTCAFPNFARSPLIVWSLLVALIDCVPACVCVCAHTGGYGHMTTEHADCSVCNTEHDEEADPEIG